MSMTSDAPARRYERFADFYPFYLSEHSDRTCRRLHFVASTFALVFLALAIVSDGRWLLAALVSGYGFAWIGHFGFEKNRPATFRQPLFSLVGDWVMYKDILTGKIPF